MSQPQPEIISPAEAKFWREQADKAPALVRKLADNVPADGENIIKSTPRVPWKILGVSMGAVLGAASFSKHVPGKWKWATGIAAAGAAGAGLALGFSQDALLKGAIDGVKATHQGLLSYADALEKEPGLKDQLADMLGSRITAEMIQKHGLEGAVASAAITLGLETSRLGAGQKGFADEISKSFMSSYALENVYAGEKSRAMSLQKNAGDGK